MFRLILILFIVCVAMSVNAQHSLIKVWETDSVIAIPESVLPDEKGDMLYVSLIDGAPWAADGKGGVGKLSREGKHIDMNWVTGLHAPKGMAYFKNRLYVADMSDVVIINRKTGKIEKKINIESATGLNDVTVTKNGVVYVSDSKEGRIWRVENDEYALYQDSVKGVNGLKMYKDDLYVGAGKSFVKLDANKVATKIAEVPQGIDGIEPVGNGDFIVTSWGGWIYYIGADGKVETLLDTHLEKRNTADIGYDPVTRIVYVPTFNAKTVAAYKLQ